MKLWSKFKKVEKEGDKKRVFHFFETISNSVFIVIVGLFFTIFLACLGVSVLFFKPIYNQIALFTLLGIVCFCVSYRFFRKANGKYLRNLTYENFQVSRRKLFSWVIYTFNFYFIFVWFILIILGSTSGFNIHFPTADNKLAFIVTDDHSTKVLGFILLSVHLFLLVLIKAVIYYWDRMFKFAAKEFEKRRKVLAEVRSKAEEN